MQDRHSKQMKNLIEQLNSATKAYDEGHPIMSDEEWDTLYFKLLDAEEEAGFALQDSPTQRISYQVVNKLEKVEHNHKMLSLDKTKDSSTIKSFLNNKSFIAMCKMDGLTCSLHYQNGFLVGAETRGDGIIGEDVLHNAKVIPSIPNHISYRGELIIDGEIICPYNKFTDFEKEYKNPRNFAAGSIRLLDSKECETRNLKFVAWEVIKGLDEHITHFYKDSQNQIFFDETTWYEKGNNTYLSQKLMDLTKLGFYCVPFLGRFNGYTSEQVDEVIEELKVKAKSFSYPIDGIVFKFDDIEYGKSLGETAHHFKNAMAYKFYDETYETKIKDVEWTMGRTGVLTPVAIVEPIEIDGTIITRASLHNYGIMFNELKVTHKGQKVEIFKANMIIPQIAKTYPDAEEEDEILVAPTKCPICGGRTEIRDNNGIQTLVCTNDDCEGKFINKLDHFVGKKGLDIKGISKATLEKLMDWGWINNLEDIFRLKEHEKEWISKTGFGAKSVKKILDSIEASKTCTLDTFISALGIPFIGKTVAKDLVKYVYDYGDFRDRVIDRWNFASIANFGEAKMQAILDFDYTEADILERKYLTVTNPQENENTKAEQSLSNLTFVITGKLQEFKNRAELVAAIEALGGKVAGAISSKTDYLINNDINSTSSKNLAAKKLNIPIITEQEVINMFNN